MAYIGEGRVLNRRVYNVYLQNYASSEFLKHGSSFSEDKLKPQMSVNTQASTIREM